MDTKKTMAEYYFDYQKRIEEEHQLNQKIDNRITQMLLPYMKQQQDLSTTKEEIKHELRFSLLRELRPEIYKIVRECLNDTTLNIKIK